MEGSSSSSSSSFISIENNLSESVVDELYFSALIDEEEIYPISDEKYAHHLHLQEALFSSSSTNSITLQIIKKSESTRTKITTHYSGGSSQAFCNICMDYNPVEAMFSANSCTHSFCRQCVCNYVAVKIQENISMVKCPDMNCKSMLEPQNCREIIPEQVFDRWENALCESLILGSEKFFCPFKDCSAMLVDDGGETITSAVCPHCLRLFCAQCKVPWHSGFQCKEFRERSVEEKEEKMVRDLAKDNKWNRCPNCRFYVEKISGCLHISCRCGYEFCYGCGSQWTQVHACNCSS